MDGDDTPDATPDATNAATPADPSIDVEGEGEMAANATAAVEADDRGARSARTVATALLGVLAVVLLHGAVLGAWTLRTALDSDRFEGQIADILQNEDVSDSLAAIVVDELAAGIDLRTPLVEVSPEAFEPLIDALLAGVEARLTDRVGELVRDPVVSENVAAVAGRAHALAIDVLEGEQLVDRVEVDDGRVRINLVPLTARALVLVQEFGVLGDVDVPELDPADPADQHVAQLELALDLDLPDDFAQPVVFSSDRLEQAGETVDLARSLLLLARRGLWVLALGGIGAAALAIWASRRRWRAAGLLVGGVVAASMTTLLVSDTIADRVPEAVVDPGAKATVREVVFGLQRSLETTLTWYAVITVFALGAAAYVRFRRPTGTPPT